jgi:enoyl-CoA hydratase/carnithine racemase
MWAERVLESDLARTAVQTNAATPADLRRISDAWRRWAADEDGWLSILHGEILGRV